MGSIISSVQPNWASPLLRPGKRRAFPALFPILFLLTFFLTLCLNFVVLADTPSPDEQTEIPSEDLEFNPDLLTPIPQSTSLSEVDSLINQAQEMFTVGRPIDGRSKLLHALQLAPKDYRVHLMLGAYYLSEVGHFRLAYRYLKTSEELFESQYGSEKDNSLDRSKWREHAKLLYLLSEAELNLDHYQAALEVLDRFASRYFDVWYPGTRAWVLMKLKRIDEAIQIAQAGIVRGADLSRTYNILGILLSLKDNRKLALEAFARAIRTEWLMGGKQMATPLNNAGEVYRELFQDHTAEAAWVRSIKLPDGCEHILPSLNLSILLLDELRLKQAERTLSDFEACYRNHAEREDTEHRALMALQRGRLAMRAGDFDRAITLLQVANEKQQWFGKIGTNESDLRIAARLTLAQAYEAKANAEVDSWSDSWMARQTKFAKLAMLKLKSLWLMREARKIVIEELENFEDIYIRHTDTMLEYPTLGDLVSSFSSDGALERLSREESKDQRPLAKAYYQLYRAQVLRNSGDNATAISLLEDTLKQLRDFDRLARAVAIRELLLNYQDAESFFYSGASSEPLKKETLTEELFDLLPAQIRAVNLKLPVSFLLSADTPSSVVSSLNSRFTQSIQSKPRFRLEVSSRLGAEIDKNSGQEITITLYDRGNIVIASHREQLLANNQGLAALINTFMLKCFSSRTDFSGEPLPNLELMAGIE